MKKYDVSLIGYYGDEHTIKNGQTERTKSVAAALKKYCNNKNIYEYSYHTWKKNPIKFLKDLNHIYINSVNIIIFPDANAIRLLLPLSLIYKKIYNFKLFYNVIGGWSPDFFEKSKFFAMCARKLDWILCETSTLEEQYNIINIKNTTIFPNFKEIPIESSYNKQVSIEKPLQLYFASRIMEEKGVSDLIEVLQEINSERVIYTLDLYGPINKNYTETLDAYIMRNKDWLTYKGVLDADKVSQKVNKYFMHVFPTKFKTEGYPGSIIDAFCAGVPTLAAKWNSATDVITDNKNGILFEINNKNDLKSKLLEVSNNPYKILSFRRECIKQANKLSPSNIIRILAEKLKEA